MDTREPLNASSTGLVNTTAEGSIIIDNTGAWTFGQSDSTDAFGTKYNKENLLRTFKQLDTLSREELISAIRVNEAANKILDSTISIWMRPQNKFDNICSLVSLEELESAHAELLIEESIKTDPK